MDHGRWASLSRLVEMNVNQSDDPRVGSGRDNSTGGTLSHLSSSGSNSASLSALGSTFVPVLVYSVVCLLIFFLLRPRCPSVYAPRTLPGLLLPDELSQPLPKGWFGWIKPFFRVSDTFLINRCSLDGFFFLRYVKVLAVICLVGCCFTWPILLPLHATGGRNLTQLDLLTIGNVASPKRLYGHLFVSWLFFGFILYMISRECIYYVNLRQAYLLSPVQSQRLSSRTVLFTSVPRNLLDPAKVRKLFGDSVKNVWIPRNTKGLKKLVDERDQTALRLEKAEVALVKMANAARRKQLGLAGKGGSATALNPPEQRSKGKSSDEVRISEKLSLPTSPQSSLAASSTDSTEQPHQDQPGNDDYGDNDEDDDDAGYTHPYGLSPSLPDLRGSVAAQYIPAESRPHHRPLANFGRRVDTIRWTRLRLKTLNEQIAKLRRKLRNAPSFGRGAGQPINALFVEFDSQASAETAFQIIAHHRPLHMSPAYIGIRPDHVVWSSLRMEWWERIARRFLVMATIAAAVIFWSIPSALVGLVSKVSFLTSKVPFLKWIEDLPPTVLGVIEGLLPALALSLLMAIVPGMLRACARAAGVPSIPLVELYTQNAYFVFQVVQVFLVTTLTSAASAAFTQILENPLSAKDLLSENLPKASNFYLSYILVQCLAGGAAELVHLFDLLRYCFVTRGAENPRLRLKGQRRLRRRHWGSVFPVFTNMGVIAICYSCIAPLILGFAGLGMCVIYLVYRYNLLYSLESDLDTRGLHYPRALIHLIVGLYLAEICMVGLFALQSAIVPLVLMVLFLIFTCLVHISINDAFSPLLYNLPRTLALQDKELSEDLEDDVAAQEDGSGLHNVPEDRAAGAASEYYDLEDGLTGDATDPTHPTAEDEHPPSDRAIEGASGLASSIKDWLVARAKAQVLSTIEPDTKVDAQPSAFTRLLATLNAFFTPDSTRKPNMLVRWLHPEIFDDFHVLRKMFPDPDSDSIFARSLPDSKTDLAEVTVEKEREQQEIAKRGYQPPEMWVPCPTIWIPRDEARVSRQEVDHCRQVVGVSASDRGAWLDERLRVRVGETATILEVRVRY